MNLELLSIPCPDGLALDAFWAPAREEFSPAVLHVHGKAGNAYHNAFLRQMYSLLPPAGISVLGLNTRGNGSIVEGFVGSECVYIGSAYEMLSESLIDITSGLSWLRSRSSKIFLQGHSHGCEKIVHYSVTQKSQIPLILLSPADSASLQREFISPRTLDEQLSALLQTSKSPWDMLPPGEYGVNRPACRYQIPTSRAALIDLLSGDNIRIFDQTHKSPACGMVDAPVLAILGGDDSLQIPDTRAFCDFLKGVFKDATVHSVESANHHFADQEQVVISTIAQWILRS